VRETECEIYGMNVPDDMTISAPVVNDDKENRDENITKSVSSCGQLMRSQPPPVYAPIVGTVTTSLHPIDQPIRCQQLSTE
jgi:hypothetical protein